MKSISVGWLTGLLLLVSLNVAGEPLVSVHGLNYPVWVERGVSTMPLSPGDSLYNGDKVHTGESGRVWLSMSDGSVVKLGQGASFVIENINQVEQAESDILEAALNVVRGAFRFTSSFFQARKKARHKIDIRVGSITAGIRGTDIWGRSTGDEDFVTLIEGAIQISHPQQDPVNLSEPLTQYTKPRNQPAYPVAPIAREQVQKLGQETELSDVLGTASVDGKYGLILMSVRDAGLARHWTKEFHAAGYAVNSELVDIENTTYHRLMLKGLESASTAQKLGDRLSAEFALSGVWVKRLN